MVLALVVGTFLLVNGGSDGRQASLTSVRAHEEAAAATSTPDPEPSAAPEAEKRRCWDGSDVEGEETCKTTSEAAQFWAFGLDPDDCRPIGNSSHSRWSYECEVRGVDVHLATYEDGSRNGRLTKYGSRKDLLNGRILAGGPRAESGRWLRTYDDAAAADGLLMYASVDARDPHDGQLLLSLRQRFADDLLRGEPVLAED